MAMSPKNMVIIASDNQITKMQGVRAVQLYFNGSKGNFKIYSLDAVDHFEDSLSVGLSTDMEEAKKQVKERYESIGKAKMSELIIDAYKAKMFTLKYQLKKYPAIIFDNKYVVYGEFNINKALNYYINNGGSNDE
jgi:integrating conjugative element protein (TIGR03757 family)